MKLTKQLAPDGGGLAKRRPSGPAATALEEPSQDRPQIRWRACLGRLQRAERRRRPSADRAARGHRRPIDGRWRRRSTHAVERRQVAWRVQAQAAARRRRPRRERVSHREVPAILGSALRRHARSPYEKGARPKANARLRLALPHPAKPCHAKPWPALPRNLILLSSCRCRPAKQHGYETLRGGQHRARYVRRLIP